MIYHLKLPNFLSHQLNFAIKIYYFYIKNQKHTNLSIIAFSQLFLIFFIDSKSILCFDFEIVKVHLTKIIDHYYYLFKYFLVFK